ncbi:hypothetical protein FB107DRAFT_249707 [Schizophyllum commune]
MPPTYDPQACLNTALRRVLVHVRYFVADRRRASLVPQGLCRRVTATKSGSQARRRHSSFDSGLCSRPRFASIPAIPTFDSFSSFFSSSSRLALLPFSGPPME